MRVLKPIALAILFAVTLMCVEARAHQPLSTTCEPAVTHEEYTNPCMEVTTPIFALANHEVIKVLPEFPGSKTPTYVTGVSECSSGMVRIAAPLDPGWQRI